MLNISSTHENEFSIMANYVHLDVGCWRPLQKYGIATKVREECNNDFVSFRFHGPATCACMSHASVLQVLCYPTKGLVYVGRLLSR